MTEFAPVANAAPSLDTPMLAEQLPPETPPIKPARLLSLDVFRGITIAMMLLVNNGGIGTPYYPLDHADWGKGWTPTDLVFPFFLFIVGVAIPFSLSKRSSIGQSRGNLLGTIWLRALSLFMLGQLLQGLANPKTADMLPAAFHILKFLRIVCLVYGYGSILLLLIPFRGGKLFSLLPVLVCVGFYALALIMAWANRYALAHGLPEDFTFGTGLFNPAMMRIPGILQRIGFCYGVAASLMLFFGWRTAVAAIILLLSAYSVLMFYAPFHDPVTGKVMTGTITEEHNFARSIDEAVFDKYRTGADGKRLVNAKGKGTYVWHHTWRDYPDNEGIVSTLPAICTALFGAIAGVWLRTTRLASERCAGLLVGGVFVTAAGAILNLSLIPILKDIWTPSYAVFTAGLAMLGLGAVYWIVDIHQYRRWSWPFVVFGMNSIAAFVAAGVVIRIAWLISMPNMYLEKSWNHEHRKEVTFATYAEQHCAAAVHSANDWLQVKWPNVPFIIDNEGNTSLAYGLSFVFSIFILMMLLYFCRIYVKV